MRQQQKGMALLVSMVLIFVMSVLGISAMRSATLEGRMVSNSYQKGVTFEAADSASDAIIDDISKIENSICTSGPQTTTLVNLSADSKVTTEGYVTYGGRTVVLDFSLGAGFGALKFVAGGKSSLNNTVTKTEISQGIYKIVPAEAGASC